MRFRRADLLAFNHALSLSVGTEGKEKGGKIDEDNI